MDKIRIKGNSNLFGEINISGSKNSSLPILVSSLLSKNDLILKNIPKLEDISSMIKLLKNYGVSRLIYTDIDRDGTKQSPNFEETIKVADASSCPVIISGGVSSIHDIKKAKELNNQNIEGIIVGKAIYDGDIKLEELAKELDA